MHSAKLKIGILLLSSVLLSGCIFSKKQQEKIERNVIVAPSSSPVVATPQALPSPTPTAVPTTKKNDEPEDLQKDLDSVTIESDFNALVK